MKWTMNHLKRTFIQHIKFLKNESNSIICRYTLSAIHRFFFQLFLALCYISCADHKAVNVYVNQRANISPTRLGAIFFKI